MGKKLILEIWGPIRHRELVLEAAGCRSGGQGRAVPHWEGTGWSEAEG